MNSSQEILGSYSKIKGILEVLLQDQNPLVRVFQEEEYPLLSLETDSDTAGFAVINGSPESSYASAYGSFKKLYRKNHDLWKDRNLSFIVCPLETRTIYDAFFNSLESDVYFCRKYIVQYCEDQKDLELELLRLPFLPLQKGRTIGLDRPPSAQTLLQTLNVDAQLASQIIVPQKYSAKRIVEQLIQSEQKLPEITSKTVIPEVQHQTQPVEHTRITSVEIKAFRAYNKKQEFDVNADVVVLYGPNGLGKTSFFDAIDYGCTGRIARLCRSQIDRIHFSNIARHLGSSSDEGYVSLHVTKGNDVHSVTRNIVDWGEAVIDKTVHPRAEVLQFLTSAQWGSKKARIQNLERLFRATHLFSQTDPELLVEFEKNSTLSPDLVSRMLALDDYASGLVKVESVLDYLKREINKFEEELNELNVETVVVKSRIQELPPTEEPVEAGQHINKMASELIKELSRNTNINVLETEPTEESVRDWRAMVDSILKDTKDEGRKLKEGESGFAQFEKNNAFLKNITSELSLLKETLKEKTDEFKSRKEKKNILARKVERERVVLEEAGTRLRSLEELDEFQKIFYKTNSSRQKWNNELLRFANETEKTTKELQNLLLIAEDLRFKIAEQKNIEQACSNSIQVLLLLKEGYSTWDGNRKLMNDLHQNFTNAQSSLKEIEEAINKIQEEISTKENELGECERKYKDLMVSGNELTRLLDEIEDYVQDGICPTCGIDHKTKSVLIERIHSQKQIRPVHLDELAMRCGELRKLLKNDRELLAIKSGEQKTNDQNLKRIKEKLYGLNKEISEYEKAAVGQGIELDDNFLTNIGIPMNEKNDAYRSSLEILNKLEAELVSSTASISELDQKREALEIDKERAESAVIPLEEEITEMRTKVTELGLSLEMTPEEKKNEIEFNISRINTVQKHIGEFTLQVDKLEKKIINTEIRITEINEKITSLIQDKDYLDEAQSIYHEDISSVIDLEDFSLDIIKKKREDNTNRLESLELLKRQCLTLERVIDATQRTAMMAELESKIQSLESKSNEFIETKGRMTAVRKWFLDVKKVLEKQSSGAIANHVDALGPLATMIQKRIRAVYGFGDICLHAKGSEIPVEVKWKNKHVKPTDYFSDSQKQILMLSLFLSGRLTQSWSGFAPILMDDPVTHFDDLNAFGFVELIRGLINASPGKRQFFISTCEGRLFELMLKKFSRVEGGAKFYKFESISHDGPNVKEIIIN